MKVSATATKDKRWPKEHKFIYVCKRLYHECGANLQKINENKLFMSVFLEEEEFLL